MSLHVGGELDHTWFAVTVPTRGGTFYRLPSRDSALAWIFDISRLRPLFLLDSLSTAYSTLL